MSTASTSPAPATPSASAVTFGLDTFGDVTVDADRRSVGHAQTLRDVVAEAELADRVGIDHFSVGEHHRPDFAVSAPDMVLAAIPSPSPCSAIRSRTTRRSSRRSSTCSPPPCASAP